MANHTALLDDNNHHSIFAPILISNERILKAIARPAISRQLKTKKKKKKLCMRKSRVHVHFGTRYLLFQARMRALSTPGR